jgi:apolipoprotein N-acyltransferase
MALIRIDHHPSPRQLRIFAAAWLVFFAALGVLAWRRGSSGTALSLAIAAVAVPAIGLFWGELLRWVYVGMSYLAFPIGFVLSHVILAIVYYLVFTPIGLVMRLCGYDPMQRRFDPQARSYWSRRAAAPEPGRYFRQF